MWAGLGGLGMSRGPYAESSGEPTGTVYSRFSVAAAMGRVAEARGYRAGVGEQRIQERDM